MDKVRLLCALSLAAVCVVASAKQQNAPIIMIPGTYVFPPALLYVQSCSCTKHCRRACDVKTRFARNHHLLVRGVAGLAGSVLEERLNRTNAPHWYCAKEVDDWQTVWLSVQSASRPDCFIDELLVYYDNSTGR